MYYGSSCSFSSLDYSCLAAPSRCISDVLWLLLQLQLPGLQLPLQLHLAAFPMYYGCSCKLQLPGLQLPLQLHLAAFP